MRADLHGQLCFRSCFTRELRTREYHCSFFLLLLTNFSRTHNPHSRILAVPVQRQGQDKPGTHCSLGKHWFRMGPSACSVGELVSKTGTIQYRAWTLQGPQGVHTGSGTRQLGAESASGVRQHESRQKGMPWKCCRLHSVQVNCLSSLTTLCVLLRFDDSTRCLTDSHDARSFETTRCAGVQVEHFQDAGIHLHAGDRNPKRRRIIHHGKRKRDDTPTK